MRSITVPKNQLMLIAGVVWCTAGIMVLLVGVPLQLRLAPSHLVLVPLAALVFLVFHRYVFTRLVHKHTRRIREAPEERLPIWSFFTASSWVVMLLMVAAGMGLRSSHLAPDWAVAFFYSGLGTALFIGGLRFLAVFMRKDVLATAPGVLRTDD